MVRGHSRTKSRYGSIVGVPGAKDREQLQGGYDVVICGASFGGLAVARELSGSGARVLMLDRYEIGERATSACGIPTEWLRALDLMDVELQRFGELVVHTPGNVTVLDMPYTFSTFNYDELCEALWRECDATFEIAAVEGRRTAENGEITVETDRGPVTAPLVVDALGWPRILASDNGFQPIDAPLTRALRGSSPGPQRRTRGLGRPPLRAGRLWVALPAGEELRIGACSYEPNDHIREGTDRLAADLGGDQVRYQGNWIPHRLRPPTEAGVFSSATRPASAYR